MKFFENGIDMLYLHDMTITEIKQIDRDIYIRICLGDYSFYTNDGLKLLYLNNEVLAYLDLKFTNAVLNGEYNTDENEYDIYSFDKMDDGIYLFSSSTNLDYYDIQVTCSEACIHDIHVVKEKYGDPLYEINPDNNKVNQLKEMDDCIFIDKIDISNISYSNNVKVSDYDDKLMLQFDCEDMDDVMALLIKINMINKDIKAYSAIDDEVLVSKFIEHHYDHDVLIDGYKGSRKVTYGAKANYLYKKFCEKFNYAFMYNESSCFFVAEDIENPVYIYYEVKSFNRYKYYILYNRRNKDLLTKINEYLKCKEE